MAEDGPLEVHQAAQAFNDMQERLRRLVENRTRMLAAISHDLRTPITLLRLRAELIDNAEDRDKTLATPDQMECMIASTLAFAREDAETEERRVADLAALLDHGGRLPRGLSRTGAARKPALPRQPSEDASHQ